MSNLLNEEVLSALRPEGRTVMITIGNSLRADDGVGPFIGRRIADQKDFLVLNALMNPEDIVEDAIAYRPGKIVVIDAADFGGSPGEIRTIPLDQIQRYNGFFHPPLPDFRASGHHPGGDERQHGDSGHPAGICRIRRMHVFRSPADRPGYH
jgi:hydrogenase 3 maturation protease